MVTYELGLNQGDSNDVGMLLKENGVGVDLTGSIVTFSMKNEAGIEFNILCTPGGTVNGTTYTFAQGGITVPFSATHTVNADIFQGKVYAVKSSIQKTFPSNNTYITVKIWEAI
ncbi:MAG: hypothetical protein PHN69_04080 [Candidatus Pacebacteria bacterium]|nr:hypothetical protein [Fermentimonas sp.]MDD4804331.1 hypothetical protein [Candidatus Paceibacterota bacterium]